MSQDRLFAVLRASLEEELASTKLTPRQHESKSETVNILKRVEEELTHHPESFRLAALAYAAGAGMFRDELFTVRVDLPARRRSGTKNSRTKRTMKTEQQRKHFKERAAQMDASLTDSAKAAKLARESPGVSARTIRRHLAK